MTKKRRDKHHHNFSKQCNPSYFSATSVHRLFSPLPSPTNPRVLLSLPSDSGDSINLDPLLLKSDIGGDNTTVTHQHRRQEHKGMKRKEYDDWTYPIAPITPSLRFAYPRFVAGIQTSKQSSVICEISVARSLHHQLISPSSNPQKSKDVLE
jgi:hypothetical protein